MTDYRLLLIPSLILLSSCHLQRETKTEYRENYIYNGNWTEEDGIGLRRGWSTFSSTGFSSVRTTPIEGGGLDFFVSGCDKYVFYEQFGLHLLPAGKYRLAYEVKTWGLKGAQHHIVLRDGPGRMGWSSDQRSENFPDNTNGEWVRVEKDLTMLAMPQPGDYRLTIMCIPGNRKVAHSHFALRNLSLSALTPETAAGSRPPSADEYPKLTARIVPIDPMLSELDANDARMTFFWPSKPACNVTNCQLTATLGSKIRTKAFSPDGRVCIDWGAVRPGELPMAVAVHDQQGMLLATNNYPARVMQRSAVKPNGRRLNNFVTELVNRPLKDGVVMFERPESGWVWISFDGDVGSPIGYLDDAGTPSVYRRSGERLVETQRFVSAGRHRLRISGAQGGRLRINAVKIVMVKMPRILNDSLSQTYNGIFRYSLPFAFYTGSVSAANTTYLLDFAHPERTRYIDPTYLGLAFERGIDYVAGVKLGADDPRRDDATSIEACLTGPLWQLGVPLAIDENLIAETPRRTVNFTETVWNAVCRHPERRINLYYADAPFGRTYNCPEKHVSEIASIVNSGTGTGFLAPELYAPVLPSVEELNDYLDAYAECMASAVRLVPAARGRMVLLPASFNLIGHWCTYTTPSTDVKVHTAEMLRTFAVDPRFSDAGGIGFTGADAGDEEIRRWGIKCLRYYALEGGTEDLAKKHGFRWTPGFVKNEDFASGLSDWTVDGAVLAEKIDGYGKTFQTRLQGRLTHGDVGDAVATFESRDASANKLSQRITGLVPGQYYSAFCCVMERDGLMEARPRLKQCHFSIRLEGATETPELRYELTRDQRGALKVAKGAQRRAAFHILRYVFKANSSEAMLVLTDRDDDGTMNAAGTRLSVNSVMVKPYYLEEGEDPLEIARALGWIDGNRRR